MIVKNNYILQEDQQNVRLETVPKNPLRITGSRLGKILDRSPYSTPFQQWCIMERFFRSYRESLEIHAGHVIEPALRDYLKKLYEPLNYKVVDPKYCYDEKCFEFFPRQKIFGGKWDALL